uniref:Stathmin domain containing 1 n=1 Tax=Salarias fasciatus TaxID=181472 RepID=A0A672J0G7_SALFA
AGVRGDSAVSKGTTDSGVVMENREAPALPGTANSPLSKTDVVFNSSAAPGLLQKESAAQERLKSSEILEELLNEGIIPVEPARGTNSRAGEAYSIMLDDSEEVRRRPPARLESLRVKKTQSVHNKEEIDEKMRQVEERRKVNCAFIYEHMEKMCVCGCRASSPLLCCFVPTLSHVFQKSESSACCTLNRNNYECVT